MLWQLKVTAPPPEGEAGEGKIINPKLEYQYYAHYVFIVCYKVLVTSVPYASSSCKQQKGDKHKKQSF